MNSARPWLLATLALTACGSTTVQPFMPPVSDVPVADQSADLPPTADAPIGTDGTSTSDAITTSDGTVSSDVPSTIDVPVGTDGGTPFALTGLWRLIRYEFRERMSGRTISVTDRDTPYTDPDTGMMTNVRVNGLMQVDSTHLALSSSSLANGHFYAYTPTGPTDNGYTANGLGAAGVLDEPRGEFTPTGAMNPVLLVRQVDGTVALSFSGGEPGTRSVWTRASDSGPALPSINAAGFAMARGPSYDGVRPRVALLWDVPGGNRLLETNGSALRFVGRFANYPVTLTGTPPMEAIGPWMSTRIAVAHIVIYDDVNSNTRFDQGTDRLDGLSPVVITWRAAAPFTPPPGGGHFPLRLVSDGWRFGHVHFDISLGRADVVGYDGTVPVSPDIPVSRDISMGIADLL